jgi:hypothetical protein
MQKAKYKTREKEKRGLFMQQHPKQIPAPI